VTGRLSLVVAMAGGAALGVLVASAGLIARWVWGLS
jgi:hypothetical protein